MSNSLEPSKSLADDVLAGVALGDLLPLSLNDCPSTTGTAHGDDELVLLREIIPTGGERTLRSRLGLLGRSLALGFSWSGALLWGLVDRSLDGSVDDHLITFSSAWGGGTWSDVLLGSTTTLGRGFWSSGLDRLSILGTLSNGLLGLDKLLSAGLCRCLLGLRLGISDRLNNGLSSGSSSDSGDLLTGEC